MIRLFTIVLLISLSAFAQGAITHEETSTNHGLITAGNDLTVTLSGAPTDGELLIAFCHRNTSVDLTATGFPAGFTKATAISVGTTTQKDRRMDVGYKIASSDGTTYAFTNPDASISRDMQCAVMVYSGVNGTQLDVTPTASHYVLTSDTDAPDPPSITTVTNNAMVIIFASTSGTQNTRSCTAPSGYTRRFGNTDSRDNAFICGAEKLVTSAGAENPAAWAIANGNGCGTTCTDDTYAATIAIAPAAATSNSVLFYVR
jgi:hypothetical protein